MERARYTPGPWGIDMTSPGKAIIYGPNGSYKEEHIANARLLAAAPALAEALEALLDLASPDDATEEEAPVYAAALAALRAAGVLE